VLGYAVKIDTSIILINPFRYTVILNVMGYIVGGALKAGINIIKIAPDVKVVPSLTKIRVRLRVVEL
jgi:hypothetical protein